MKTFRAILAMMALLVVAGQTFRHVYVKWIEPRDSVLLRFRDPAEQDIAASKSLGELLALYEDARKKVQAADKERAVNQSGESGFDYERHEREPYRSEDQLRRAIEQWEDHNQQIHELHYFWWCGCLCALLGFTVERRLNPWLGLSALVLGFLEMIWATSPAFRTFGAEVEFDRLLTLKTVYSSATLVMLLAGWHWMVKCRRESEKPADGRPVN